MDNAFLFKFCNFSFVLETVSDCPKEEKNKDYIVNFYFLIFISSYISFLTISAFSNYKHNELKVYYGIIN